MNSPDHLAATQPGQRARVLALLHNPDMNRRLQELGLIEGTLVECLYRSPWGSPAAYLIRGAVVAIRSCDARCITVETNNREVYHCD